MDLLNEESNLVSLPGHVNSFSFNLHIILFLQLAENSVVKIAECLT